MNRPNILHIMADQHRYDFLGCLTPEVKTPNLDALAARGMLFTRCCTNSPICAPARISLATGLLPSRTGSLTNHDYLPSSVPTFYQRLRDHGYRTGCVGKLDLAKPDKYNGRDGKRPRVYGFGFTDPEEVEGKMHAGNTPEPLGPYGFRLKERGLWEAFSDDYRKRAKAGWVKGGSYESVLPADAFADTYIGQRAVQWLSDIDGDFPWYYFVSFAGPHDPFDPPQEYYERYRNAVMPKPVKDDMDGKPAWQKKRVVSTDDEFIQRTRRLYAASTTAIDDQVGHIMKTLEERGLLDSTYIIYSSDHGEMLGDHGLYIKHTAYEPSMRVPLIAAGPGISPGRYDGHVELMDLNPTVCGLAGLPAQPGIDARSFTGILHGTETSHREHAVTEEYNYRAIRTGRYKLIDNFNDMKELYDLENDPDELRNIAPDNAGLVNELWREMNGRFAEGGANR